MQGVKDDELKLRWDLLPTNALEEIIRVLMYGAEKYEEYNWKKVPDSRRRYFSAALRHVVAWFGGEQKDKDTGFNHLAHAACCVLFMLSLDLKDRTSQDEEQFRYAMEDARRIRMKRGTQGKIQETARVRNAEQLPKSILGLPWVVMFREPYGPTDRIEWGVFAVVTPKDGIERFLRVEGGFESELEAEAFKEGMGK